MFTAVPIGDAMARFVPIAITTPHGTGLIPSASAMEIQIGVSMAATLPFCIKRVRTLVSMVITTVRTITEALSPPNRFSTKPAIIAPPPDASSPVPSPVIAPIQISTSQGSSASVDFKGTQPVAKRMVGSPQKSNIGNIEILVKGGKTAEDKQNNAAYQHNNRQSSFPTWNIRHAFFGDTRLAGK